MSINKEPLKENENGNKPVQEDKSSEKQIPAGNKQDLKKNNDLVKDEDDNDTNSVGIAK